MSESAMRWLRVAAQLYVLCVSTATPAQESAGPIQCIPPVTYVPLDGTVVGLDSQGVPALGTYERISPDGRFILRSYSAAKVGTVSLMELAEDGKEPIRVYRTPFSNEAFPVQGTWRYLIDVSGEHYRFADILREQAKAKPLFRAGMTGFYAAASELTQKQSFDAQPSMREPAFIRSLSWPQTADPDSQGVGPLQLETIEVSDDGRRATVVRTTGARFICSNRSDKDGSVFALPMISVDGLEFSAIPQSPKAGPPSMRVYGLDQAPLSTAHPCDLRADLGLAPGKAAFGFPSTIAERPFLTYSDLGSAYVFDRTLNQTFRLDHTQDRTLVSAFPGLTRDGRVIYGATWRDCQTPSSCTNRAGYVVADPYQSQAYRAYWRTRGRPPPKACITRADVAAVRAQFAHLHNLPH